ncbi:MAG: hypoxanthine phosphoribosyltransferase [Ruminococcus sp.]|nr:hypoxanthine phosphoribosyltransferase [Ruminococcus sp.]
MDILISEKELQKRVKLLGEEITKAYEGKPLLMLCMLKGASVFFADLIRNVSLPLEIDFMRVSSYENSTESNGEVKFLLYPSLPLAKYHVLLVEDILDTGTTLYTVIPELLKQNPLSLKICTLLDKKERRKFPVEAEYVGFSIPDVFVVGYGLDYAEKERNLPYIGKYI